MASEERLRELEEKYEGYTVYDNRGEKIGKVDDLFIDDADREEYIGVKMGFLGRKSTLIPMDIVRVNEADRAIEVSESKDHVKNAPSFDDDEDITHEYEERIRSHFGLQSTEASSTRGSYSGYSDTGGDQGSSDQGSQDSASHESSAVDTEYGERTGSSAGGEPAGGQETGGTPSSRHTEETETFEEGGRTKVRRRIIREEIVEEDPDNRS
ncbi:MAG TPA: PRC-barrel domain-containing protein [Rubrobacteraceae bacterium]|nr:PRC-barrel domain-containing protein [Rubrobacteraceae bacterium]